MPVIIHRARISPQITRDIRRAGERPVDHIANNVYYTPPGVLATGERLDFVSGLLAQGVSESEVERSHNGE